MFHAVITDQVGQRSSNKTDSRAAGKLVCCFGVTGRQDPWRPGQEHAGDPGFVRAPEP